MALTIQLIKPQGVPIEVESLIPERVRSLSIAEVEQLPIQVGNQSHATAEFFQVSGDPTDETIRFLGDCSGVHWIGAKMASGEIIIEADAGRHVGSEMSGGAITVSGYVGDWLGAEMSDGTIRVSGNAGHLVGAAYRGSPVGMRGGTIIVNGKAGNEVGHTMRRGTIAIAETIGDLAGFNMLAGTIVVGGNGGIRHGAGMKRGTIIFLAGEHPPMLPTFRSAGSNDPLFLQVLLRTLDQQGFQPLQLSAEKDSVDAAPQYELFHGDFLEAGRGEIWLAKC